MTDRRADPPHPHAGAPITDWSADHGVPNGRWRDRCRPRPMCGDRPGAPLADRGRNGEREPSDAGVHRWLPRLGSLRPDVSGGRSEDPRSLAGSDAGGAHQASRRRMARTTGGSRAGGPWGDRPRPPPGSRSPHRRLRVPLRAAAPRARPSARRREDGRASCSSRVVIDRVQPASGAVDHGDTSHRERVCVKCRRRVSRQVGGCKSRR
jgi:hypothetical protein